MKEIEEKHKTPFSASEPMICAVQSSIKLLHLLMQSDADPRNLLSTLEADRLGVLDRDRETETPLQDSVRDLSETVQIAISWLMEKEMRHRRQAAITTSLHCTLSRTGPMDERVCEMKRQRPVFRTPMHIEEGVEQERSDDLFATSESGVGDVIIKNELEKNMFISKDIKSEIDLYESDNDDDSGISLNREENTASACGNSEDLKRDCSSNKCEECFKTFTTAGTLRVHMLTHLTDEAARRPYACDQCDKRFTQAGSLSVHKRSHMAKDDPRLLKYKSVWTCRVCGKKCAQRCILAAHIKTHLGDENAEESEWKRQHKCQFCGRGFTTNVSRRHHERLHTGERPFQCKLCPRSYTNKNLLNIHIKKHATGSVRIYTGEAYPKNYQCTLCPRKFRRNFELAAHMKRHADDTVGFSSDEDDVRVVEKSFKCSKCWKTFDLQSKLRRHQDGVHGGLPHPCSLCQMEYRLQKNLVNHMKSEHEVELESERPPVAPRPYKCAHCPSNFTTQYALDKHGKRHQGPSSFKCSHCGDEFESFTLLGEHKRSAHDPEPYECRDCWEKFGEYATLTEHKTVCDKRLSILKIKESRVAQNCSNCAVTESSTWRRTESGALECNSCRLYFQLHGSPRPNTLWNEQINRRKKKKVEESATKQSRDGQSSSIYLLPFNCRDCGKQFKRLAERTEHTRLCDERLRYLKKQESSASKKCSNCSVTSSPAWRRNETGALECNSCRLYFRLHATKRPMALWTKNIWRRKRRKQEEEDDSTTEESDSEASDDESSIELIELD